MGAGHGGFGFAHWSWNVKSPGAFLRIACYQRRLFAIPVSPAGFTML